MSNGNLKYWERTWDLALADKAVSIDSSVKSNDLTNKICTLIDKNPDRAYEIAQHAMQTEGLLFRSINGSETELPSYVIVMCKAASYDDRCVDLILKHMEKSGWDHTFMFDKNCGWEKCFYDDLLSKQMNNGKIKPGRLFEILRKGSRYINDPRYEKFLTRECDFMSSATGSIHEKWAAEEEGRLHQAMADCVVKDPKLWDKFFKHVNATKKMNGFIKLGDDRTIIKCCNGIALNNKELSKSFCEDVVGIANKIPWDFQENLQPALEQIANSDLSYFYKNRNLYNTEFTQQVALKEHSIIPSLEEISKDNLDAFATIYEKYAVKTYAYDDNELLGQKNVVLGDGRVNQEIMNTIRDKILESGKLYAGEAVTKPVQVWLVKSAQKFPNLVHDCLNTKDLPYVEMCLRNIENPEKENIGSLLNRLEVKEAKTIEDFQNAQDFVMRRDTCMRATGGKKQLSYDMAEAGVVDFKTAQRVDKLFYALNERPEIYGSSHNKCYPKELLPIAKSDVMQDWMYPIMVDALQKGGATLSEGRMPSERTLFDCCKAWKINSYMPQRLAKFVGTHSLKGRMLAGAIFDKMCEEGKTTPQEWRDNKVLHEKFYQELVRAEKMPVKEAFKQYIPNTAVNRKRLVGMGMEEKGIENTTENFKSLYNQMRGKGIFEKMLAKPEEAKTTFSSRLLVEVARRKFNQSR